MVYIKFIGKAKITSLGQITVPKEAREDINVKEGDELFWYVINGQLVATSELMSLKELKKRLRIK
tara:strand:+ start:262 stop:456 length:195 start_codon:yes stop_codon:yes gene_type:complete